MNQLFVTSLNFM